MKCPCKDCLCVPICRHKKYIKIVECSLLRGYLIDPCTARIRPSKRILKVEKIIHPVHWKCHTKNKRSNVVYVIKKDNKFKGKNYEMSL